MIIKAIIFDLDGTLVNSIDDLADSMNTVLSENNFPVHPVDSYYGFVGMGIRNLVVNALPKAFHENEIIDNCFTRMKVLYEENITKNTKPYDGITIMLDRLTEKGIKLSVLSNKADNLTKKVVREVFSNYSFQEVMGPSGDDLRKPNPTHALEICKKMDVNPSETAYVGDTGVDMQTANNAGMLAIGALWGFRTEQELVENGAMKVINNPVDLLKII